MNHIPAEYETIKRYKVCRIFNLVRPAVFVLGLTSAFYVSFAIFIDAKIILTSLPSVLVVFFVAYWFFLRKQRWVILKQDAISYQENSPIRVSHSAWKWYVDAEFTISYITRLELEQTWLEQRFNMGHIRMRGHTEVNARERYVEQLSERREHVVYGILDFSAFRQACQERFPNEIKKGEH